MYVRLVTIDINNNMDVGIFRVWYIYKQIHSTTIMCSMTKKQTQGFGFSWRMDMKTALLIIDC